LIEKQQVEIHRLMRHLEVQLRHTADIKFELDAIRLVLKRAPATSPSTRARRPGDGNGVGNGRNAASDDSGNTTIDASDSPT
jgi:hypothetical protein